MGESLCRTIHYSMSSLNTLETSNPYSQCTFHSSLHFLDNSNASDTNKKQTKQLVQGIKEITGSKSAYELSSECSENTRSVQRLADSVAGLNESSILLLNTTSDLKCDHDNDFAQGRRASCNPTPSTSKWHKFTNSSHNSENTQTIASFSTSDLDHLL